MTLTFKVKDSARDGADGLPAFERAQLPHVAMRVRSAMHKILPPVLLARAMPPPLPAPTPQSDKSTNLEHGAFDTTFHVSGWKPTTFGPKGKRRVWGVLSYQKAGW